MEMRNCVMLNERRQECFAHQKQERPCSLRYWPRRRLLLRGRHQHRPAHRGLAPDKSKSGFCDRRDVCRSGSCSPRPPHSPHGWRRTFLHGKARDKPRPRCSKSGQRSQPPVLACGGCGFFALQEPLHMGLALESLHFQVWRALGHVRDTFAKAGQGFKGQTVGKTR